MAEDNNFQDRDENNVGYVIPSKAFDNFDDFINTLKIPYFDDEDDLYTIEVVDGDKTVCVTQWAGRIFKREWFEDVIDYPFGDMMIKIPRDYAGYLTCLYGDYMTLPPVEKRISDHNHLYLNFDESLSLEEIKQRIK